MEKLKRVFWNEQQRRLRTLWRLIGQLLLLIIIMLPLQTVIGIVAFGMLLTQGAITPELTNYQAVQELIIQSPALNALIYLSMAVSILVSVWLAGRFLDRRRFADFGFHVDRDWWADFGFGLFLGFFLMLAIFLVELAAGWVTVKGTFITHANLTFPIALLMPLLTFLGVGFYEELFSRGYQLQNIAEGLNGGALGPHVALMIATLISSAVFSVLHAGNPHADTISTLNIFVAGVMLAIGYLLTGELAIPIGLHITWNFFQGNMFGFPVSGMSPAVTIIAISQGGPDLWTGGDFGPEAGLLGLGAMGVGALLTVLWVYWQRGEATLQDNIAQPPTT